MASSSAARPWAAGRRTGGATLVLYGIPRAGMAVSTGNAAERKAGVFEADDIREWRGHDVVDSDGHKIGELEAVYVDTSTDLPAPGTGSCSFPWPGRPWVPDTSRSLTTGST